MGQGGGEVPVTGVLSLQESPPSVGASTTAHSGGQGPSKEAETTLQAQEI